MVQKNFLLTDTGYFEKITIYRPGLLRLPDGRKTRRETSIRALEWTGRILSEWFDFGNWWSICTDTLSKVMVIMSIEIADELIDRELFKVVRNNILQNCKTM